MKQDSVLKSRRYIHRRIMDRNTGKIIEDKYFEDDDTLKITEEKFIDMLIYAFTGNIDAYVMKMINDLAVC